MATPKMRYTEVPVNVAPDVPHYVNQALRQVDRDVSLISAAAAKASDDAGTVMRRAEAGGFQGIPGVNAVPASQAVAVYARTPGNPVRAAVRELAAEGTREALAGFDPKRTPIRVVHGTNANYARPSYLGPVDWYGSVTPLNRASGDAYFVVEAEPAPWSPDLLTDLGGWYAPDLSGLTLGAAVTSLPDLSGRGRALKAAAGKVLYKSEQVGSAPGLVFDGTQMMNTDEFPETGAGPVTVFLLAKSLNLVNGTTSNSGTFYDGQSNGVMSFYRSGTTSANGYGFRRSLTQGGVAGAVGDSAPHVFVITYDLSLIHI